MVDQSTAGSGAFGPRLRKLRERAGLTQQELATGAGLSAAAIRDLEQGRSRRPLPRSVRALAAALALPPADAALLHESVRQARPVVADRPTGPPGPLRLAIFGPLAVFRGADAVPLGVGRHRVVLGRLALTPNTGVSRDELVDVLWGDEAPHSAVNLVQTYVSRLRRVLETRQGRGRRPEVLTLVAGGYRLNLATEQLDLLTGRELISRARASGKEPAAAFALLEEALCQWPGAPLADVAELRGDPSLTAIEEERIAATILHARLAGGLGRPDRALPRLRELAGRHPLHEPLQARLVVALAGAGQQAAALTTYERIRRRLAEELGIDPGAELAGAHRAVLRPTAAVTSVDARPPEGYARPWQAPAPPADFTGRADQIHRLRQLLGRDPARPAPEPVTVCAVFGVAGVGKSSLALRTAQLLRPSFPDGQLYVDLQGFGPLPVPPRDALAGFLRALGVDGRQVPRGEAECAALLRSVLADRRVLVLLDNAGDTAQVRPLVPGTGGSAVLVTSRRRLTDLAGAVVVDLEPPSMIEALSLLAATAGPARIAAEPEAAAHLAAACGLLPSALRMAGGRLASRPEWSVRTVLERLAGRRHRLERLRGGEAGLDPDCQELPAAAPRAFQMLAAEAGGLGERRAAQG
ncbi:BTAD domain-containing putative transcriptional regulator [Micromonospora okii]|uniref:BTAD domain-containing putative transcriptional regulator n=1 Tax=Micromonospora okii TaxID=1182970 RepID=UPI00210745C7|nr:BTAD domain-containing putative transcriptional regulator [Micromonospora okii]